MLPWKERLNVFSDTVTGGSGLTITAVGKSVPTAVRGTEDKCLPGKDENEWN